MRAVTSGLVLLAVLASPSAGLAVSPPQSGVLSADVKVVDSALYDALLARNGLIVAEILDDDFRLTNTLGQNYDKKAFLSACCTPDPNSKTKSLGSTESVVKKYGDTSIIFATTEMKFGDGADQKLVWRSIRIFVKSGGRWKLVAEQRTSV